MQLIECVPNISEGKNLHIIEQVIGSLADVRDVYLLHKDIGYDVNRSVLTFAGSPAAVCEAAFRVIAQTAKLIDMRHHKGSHPRIGATDVCPLIPLANISMAECVELSISLGKRVGDELAIPVYLYGESASSPERRSLAYIRAGEYENLFLRIDELLFKPDFGPAVCNTRSGAIAIGARKILIAYNILLDTKDLQIAKGIARKIREQRDGAAHDSIKWRDSQAIGWYVKDYDCCQISLNILNYKNTSLHQAYSAVSDLALKFGVAVTGSEIIGLVPKDALLDTGRFLAQKKGAKTLREQNDTQLMEEAIKFLKLDKLRSFLPQEKVLEYQLDRVGLLSTEAR